MAPCKCQSPTPNQTTSTTACPGPSLPSSPRVAWRIHRPFPVQPVRNSSSHSVQDNCISRVPFQYPRFSPTSSTLRSPIIIIPRIILRIIRQIRIINIPPPLPPHTPNRPLAVPLKGAPLVLGQLAADGVPLGPGRPRLVAQVEVVGVLQRPVGEADEVTRAVDEEGADVDVPVDVGVAVDDVDALLVRG